jgi:hypothetical protein
MPLLEYAERGGPVRDGAELATTRESIARALARMRREWSDRAEGPRVRIRSVAALESLARQG